MVLDARRLPFTKIYEGPDMKRITQTQALFYLLWRNRKDKGNPFIPVWKLIGEFYIEELGVWTFISYEASARMSEMFSENPGLLAREYTRGVSGSKYYQYRIHQTATPKDIFDTDLLAFYKRLETARARKLQTV